MSKEKKEKKQAPLFNGAKNWRVACENCGQKPTVHPTGLCGPAVLVSLKLLAETGDIASRIH
ncbi:hypothetical protein QLG07_02530 [Erwinia sp. V90_4]|uniref:hypothetical protein n=1 Tax=Erwinia sp. V90_4 TaxID=3044239 RepID=UPI00249DF73E|nr:hypothetical protein [Erwinia sp. V90_4]MDI3438334.1 hypothetical protein [Erwinia sp. V90_4]